ncbi:MAG: YqgE/AlgH family protein [Bradyrhizobium sp.]
MRSTIARLVRMFAALLALAAGAVQAQAPSVEAPVMLVARPGLEPPYGETVLIAVPAGNSEHAGFILNRPLPQTVANLFPDDPAARGAVQQVHLGGPVLLNTMYAVVRQSEAGGGATIPLFEDVHLAVRADAIARIVRDTPNEARYFVGFVSWAPGELEQEIASGYWYVMRPQKDAVFRENADELWSDLVRRLRTPVALQ